MSDPSLNPTQTTSAAKLVTLKLDVPTASVTGSNLNVNNSLNIITKRPITPNTSTFIASALNSSQSFEANSTHQQKTPLLVANGTNENVKLPLNTVASINSKSSISSPVSKKIIFNTINNTNSLISKPQGPIFSNSNTKVLTLSSTPNASNTTSLLNNVSNINTNKIQFVKIVNPTTNNIINSSQNVSKPFKITTISANTNTNLITTTTTNSENVQAESLINSETQQKVIPAETQVSESSALFDAITNNGSKIETIPTSANTTTLKLHTIQLVNTPNTLAKTSQPLTPSKGPVIQRMQTLSSFTNNQPITKTIVNNSLSSAQSTSGLKVLNQPHQQNTTSFNIKPTLTTLSVKSSNSPSNFHNPIQFAINKSLALNNIDVSLKPGITSIKSETNSTTTKFIKNPSLAISNIPSTNLQSINSKILSNTSQNLTDTSLSSSSSFKIHNQETVSLMSPSKTNIQMHSPVQGTTYSNKNNDQIGLVHSPPTKANPVGTNGSNRKPCNCSKSQCLKLYCDCFAMGSFCVDCNCLNCFNTIEHEEERNKAIKMVLERNPHAFQSKIATPIKAANTQPAIKVVQAPDEIKQMTLSIELNELESRHIKGCNCKKSNCLKRYCECYLANIKCSSLCKCVGCKNCDEPTKTLLQLANAADLRKQQQSKLTNQSSQIQVNYNDNCSMNSNGNSALPQQFLSNQARVPGNGNVVSLSNGTRWQRNGTLLCVNDEIIRKDGLLERHNNIDQIKLQHQQNLSRTYASLTNEGADETVSRLIQTVTDKLEFLKSSEVENFCDQRPDNEELIDEAYAEELKSLVIEEFGRCLLNIINTAEKKS